MKTVLHLVAMPWSNPLLPSPQLAALKAHIDTALGGYFQTKTYSAFVNIALEVHNKSLKNYYDEHSEHGDYLYFLICFRRFLQRKYHFRRMSLRKMLVSLNKSMGTNEAPISVTRLNALEARTRRYVDEILSPSLWKDVLNIVGFTLSYAQLYASIFCTQYLQAKYPHFKYLFLYGGETVSLPKVAGALKNFGILGLAVVGEGERKLEQIIRSILSTPSAKTVSILQQLTKTIPGIYEIQEEKVNLFEFDSRMLCSQVDRIEDLPLPFFDEYFTSVRRSLPSKILRREFTKEISLTFEGSRGCWYRKCDFCDIHRSWIGWRSASPEWIAERVLTLTARYRCQRVWFMDCTCDSWADSYARILISKNVKVDGLMELRAHHPESFWTALNLAGIRTVQVGIEALAPKLLAAMNKGTTVAQNLRVLKWLKELGMESSSNLITHHPKSTLKDIGVTKRVISQIPHFDRLDISSLAVLLGSPIDKMLTKSERRNLTERHIGTWPKSLDPYLVRNNEFELPARMENKTLMEAWDDFILWEENQYNQYAGRAAMTQTRYGTQEILIEDNRFGTMHQHYLEGATACVYDACHRGVKLTELLDYTGYPYSLLRNLLDQLVEKKLLLEIEGWYLALALRPRDELICAYIRAGPE